MSTCRGCGAEIEWVKTLSGRDMPVNLDYIEIDPAGIPHETVVTDAGQVIKGSRLFEEGSLFQTDNKVRGRIPHWATCPKQKMFR